MSPRPSTDLPIDRIQRISNPVETSDLRKAPHTPDSRDPSAYDTPLTSFSPDNPGGRDCGAGDHHEGIDLGSGSGRDRDCKTSTGLPIGTQRQFLDAAARAREIDTPLNALLTIRFDDLADPTIRDAGCDRFIRDLLHDLRRWSRGTVGKRLAYLWVRENGWTLGEHLHLAFHLPRQHEGSLIASIERFLGEPRLPAPRGAEKRTPGEIACSATEAWHLARHQARSGYPVGDWLAAYLGKGEPSQHVFRGKLRPNTCKPYRGGAFDGTAPDKYDADQGEITGTPTRYYRYDMARNLKRGSR